MKKLLSTTFCVFASLLFAQELNKPALDSLFTYMNKEKIGAGSVSILRDGKEIYANSYGNRDYENSLQNNTQTKFRIGSISKTFTATLIMKMVENGKLTLDTKLSKFYPNIINADKITIQNLLQHTSGIQNITSTPTYSEWYLKDISKPEMLAKIDKLTSDFEPNTNEKYSNTNYILLTYILEDISKTKYENLLQKYIIKPLKLTNTKIGSKISNTNNEAKSYEYQNNNYILQPETSMTVPLGAGFIVSTPTDLNTFMNALLNAKILNPTTVSQMKTINETHGFGLFNDKIDNEIGIGHNGAIDAFRSYTFCFEATKFCYSVIQNSNEVNLAVIKNNLFNATHNLKINYPKKVISVKIETKTLTKYTNTYTSTDIPIGISFFVENNTLMAQGDGQPPFALTANNQTNFTFEPAKIEIIFSEDGKTMQMIQNKRTFNFIKKD